MSLRDYFSNNKIFTGTEKPTQGKFDVGDIIVNIGPNSAEEPMWICVEAGTPGVWELCSGVNEEEIADIVQANALTAVDYTDGVDIQIDGGNIGNMNELQTTDKSSIVGAINELFQNANNGKELIANAIGEPLSSEDTFSAMSDDINSLLSTFKTNMMNSGVMVESSDKFKSLIDKIKGLTEGEGNKGIQYVEGGPIKRTNNSQSFAHFAGGTINLLYTDITNLTFTPTILIVTSIDSSTVLNAFLYNDPYLGYQIVKVVNASNVYIIKADSSVFRDNNVIRIPIPDTYGQMSFKWTAIGVGEEDTTLRDSLASILQEEGVSVTEEDDMASLIGKTDNQFNSLNTTITLLNNQVNSLTSELAGKVTPAGDAVAGNVLTGKTFINSTGQVVTGTMANRGGAQTVTPGTSNKTLNSGYYSGNITVKGDSNLVAANIVSGKNIFGVTGNAVVGKKSTASDTVIMGSQNYKNGNKIVNDVINFTILESDNKPLQVLPCFFTGSVRIKTSMWVNYSRSGSTSKLYFKLVRGTTVVKTSSTYTATYDDNYGESKAISISYDMTGIQPGDVIQMYGFTNYSSADYKGACYPMSLCGTIS